jgi:hypothetical protein
MMKLPWVSRAFYDAALDQIKELKAANAQLLELALTKQAAPVKEEEEDESMSTKPQRRLVKQIREDAENELRLKAKAAGKKR